MSNPRRMTLSCRDATYEIIKIKIYNVYQAIFNSTIVQHTNNTIITD